MPSHDMQTVANPWQKRRYENYKTLCDHLGVPRHGERWQKHMRELQGVPETEKRLTKQEMFAYWRERLTDRQIHEYASALDFLSTERGNRT